MKNIAICVIITVLTVFTITYILDACNPKGSLAAQINWAGRGECK